MKTFKIFSVIAICLTLATSSFAQTKTDTISVAGNCGMCKTTIEKAAKKAGASSADWNTESKILTVKYNSSSTNAAKIQQGVAASGYDTRDFRGSDEAYDKLHACCKYERVKKEEQPSASATKGKASCCSKEDGKTASNDGKEKSCCSKEDGKTASNDSKEKSCCAETN